MILRRQVGNSVKSSWYIVHQVAAEVHDMENSNMLTLTASNVHIMSFTHIACAAFYTHCMYGLSHALHARSFTHTLYAWPFTLRNIGRKLKFLKGRGCCVNFKSVAGGIFAGHLAPRQ